MVLGRSDGQVMTSDVDSEQGYGAMADIDYKPQQGVQHKLALDYFDKKLDVSDLGFIRRNDAMSMNYQYMWSTGRNCNFYAIKKRSLMLSNSWNTDGKVVRSGIFLRNGWTFKIQRNPNRARLFPSALGRPEFLW